MTPTRTILFLLLCAPLIAPAGQRIEATPLKGTKMAGRLKYPSLTRSSIKVELGAEKAEAARLEAGPKLRPLNARRGTVEQQTLNIRAMKKKKATLDINDD